MDVKLHDRVQLRNLQKNAFAVWQQVNRFDFDRVVALSAFVFDAVFRRPVASTKQIVPLLAKNVGFRDGFGRDLRVTMDD